MTAFEVIIGTLLGAAALWVAVRQRALDELDELLMKRSDALDTYSDALDGRASALDATQAGLLRWQRDLMDAWGGDDASRRSEVS